MTRFTFPKWYDLHVHVRQGSSMAAYITAHLSMGCAGILAMPNTRPPVARVTGDNSQSDWTIEAYRAMILEAGGDGFQDIIIPLYLTRQTTAEMILEGAKCGLLRACKYYPPHGTTNADFGAPLDFYAQNGVLSAMQEAGIILNIHGEAHGLKGEAYFGKTQNAEDIFYSLHLPAITAAFPDLKIVCEHITTRTAVNFVKQSGDQIAATITPQHLLYTVADLLQGLKYHLYCLPLLKFEEDRAALVEAALSGHHKFFAGTDSAPHTKKATACGCAAGCFTGGVAPQLYARAFDLSDKTKAAFERFLCLNGPAYYALPAAVGQFTLSRSESALIPLETPEEGQVFPLPLGLEQNTIEWRLDLSHD